MEINLCFGCMEPTDTYPCPHCGYSPNQNGNEQALRAGTVLNGKYMVGRVLGQGGFGITYIGWDLILERKVAIKEYYPVGQVGRNLEDGCKVLWYTSEQNRKEGMDIFLREARKMNLVDDIAQVVCVQDLFYENGTAYIVMDFIEGQTLKKYLEQHGPMHWEDARNIILPVARTMEQVHSVGLVHRDISPDNIMLTPDGDVRILDLGAAKNLKKNSGFSSVQVAKGGFSPPEQYFQKGTSGPYTDVYALAATLYFTLTGTIPPPAIDRMDKDTLDWNHSALKALPPNVYHAMQRAMVLRSEDRTRSMADFISQLTTVKTLLVKRICAATAACLVIGTLGIGTAVKKTGKNDNAESTVPIVVMEATPGETVMEDTTDVTGDGTIRNPYRLSSEEDLDLIRNHPDAYFVLTQDIVLKNQPFTTIESFSGKLDGKGYWIKGLRVDDKLEYCSGLFDAIEKKGVVENLGLEILAQGDNQAGTHVSGISSSNRGVISNCTVTSKIMECLSYHPIAVLNYGSVENCVTDTYAESCGLAGGAVQENDGILRGCNVTVEARNSSVIGMVYRNWSAIEECTVTISAKNCNYIGGVTGQNYAPIRNCTVTGEISSVAGGSGYYSACSSPGNGSEIIGGFYLVQDTRTKQTLPKVPNFAEDDGSDPGKGTKEDPYKLRTAEDLNRLRTEPTAHFILMRDIDFAGEKFQPIGEFSGSLDGNGHKITGIVYKFHTGEENDAAGFIRNLVPSGVVENLTMECSLDAGKLERTDGAGIAVCNEGLIRSCTVTAKAANCYAFGGIARNNSSSGRIEDCTVDVTTNGCNFVGGIAEYQLGSVIDCTATIDLVDSVSAGGIAYANSGSLKRCHAEGTIVSRFTNGIFSGIAGESIGDSQITDCTASVTRAGKTLANIGQ